MKHIPNLITSLNLVSGFLALIFAAGGNLITASWLIMGAMIFDFLDGFTARLLNAYSELGKELDSLADVVSFGVAPAFILFLMISSPSSDFIRESYGSPFTTGSFIAILSVVMPVCAAWRLAKFNIDTIQKTSFRGLPTPANAIAVISVVIAANYSDSALLRYFTESPVLLSLYTILLSILMVTRIPLLSLKVTKLAFKGNEGRYTLAALILISFIFFGIAAAPLIIPFYLTASFVSGFFGSTDLTG